MDICLICSSPIPDDDSNSIPYPSKDKQHYQTQMPTTIRFCSKCKVGIAYPIISEKDADELYAKGEYWRKASPQIPLKIFPVPYGLAQARWGLIKKSLTQNKIKLLDIGAGHGYLGLIASLDCNTVLIEYHAVEPDSAMMQYLQAMWTAKQCKQSVKIVDSIEQIDGSYDVIVLSHILEHVQDPSGFLQSITALLSHEGLLFVDVPNQDHLFKSDVFPHNLFFSLSNLRLLLEKNQMDIVSIEAWGRNMFESPSYAKAPLKMKLIGKMMKIPYRFLPSGVLVNFYTWYFGGDKKNSEGTWIRAVCKWK